MAHFRLQEVVGHHGIEVGSAHLHAVPFEHNGVVFEVLGNLEDFFIFQHWPENFYHGLGIFLACGNGHVVSFARFVGKRHAHQLSLSRFYMGGFGVKTKLALLRQFCRQFVHGLRAVHQVVLMRGIVDGFFGYRMRGQVGPFLRGINCWFGIAKQGTLLAGAGGAGAGFTFPQDLRGQTAEFQFFKNL